MLTSVLNSLRSVRQPSLRPRSFGLELERLDGMTEGPWPHIQEGSAAAVSAGIRVSERRSRLLGLDAPVATKKELSGSLGVYAERLEADRALFGTLTVEQLEELALESEALIAKARAMAQVNTSSHDHSTSPRTLPNLQIIDVPPSAEPT